MQEVITIPADISAEGIEAILETARKEEKNHKFAQAVNHYETILEFVSNHIRRPGVKLSDRLCRTFITAAERRAALSAAFYPRRKKMIKWLFEAREMAIRLGDARLQASLELYISQNYWLSFQEKNALDYFNKGRDLLQHLNDETLNKYFLKLQALVYLNEGGFLKAIEAYENSIGNIESFDDYFSLFTAFRIALVYTEIGLPQRGIGICDAIRNQCKRQRNKPLLCFSFLLEGLIHFEIRQLQNSRRCFEKTLTLACSEDIPAFEALANVSLVCIEYLEGTLNASSRHYIFLQNMPRSSWFYLPHYFILFDIVYEVYSQNIPCFQDKTNLDFLYLLSEDQLSPHIYQMLERVRITSKKNDATEAEKIKKLLALELRADQSVSTFELARLRIELARRLDLIQDKQKAYLYAEKAWQFLYRIAPDAFPADLRHLLPDENLSAEERLSDLVIGMGKALAKPDTLEQLLTSIIASISRMTRAERTAIFIKGHGSSEIKMAASRNLLKEEILDEEFKMNLIDIQQVARSGKSKITGYAIDNSENAGGRKSIITPLTLDEKNIGVLYQDSRFFSLEKSPERIEILSALSSQIALAIDRANAYDEIAKLNNKLLQENLYYIDEKAEFRPFDEIIGTSKAILDVQRLIRKVAPTPSAVLIYGETGVGKELVARAIHRESPRKDHPFIRVNCAALPESLIDSELFGYEKGAFTGAFGTKAGRFELAHQGTIFLDEVSELPQQTQSRLLRVLQEKEFQRVGGTKTLHSDFRLITATNKDLKKEVEAGRFREDLFYRLNVYPLPVPPLRERTGDIPLLAMHFLKLFNAQCNKSYSGISAAEMENLQGYNWPGNVRELSNMIERAVITGETKISFPGLKNRINASSLSGKNYNLKELEELTIMDALKECRGKIGGKNGAAKLLGLERTTLMHRMKKIGINVEYKISVKKT